MKHLFITLIVILFTSIVYSQDCDCAYPIIFVHGLDSSHETWVDFSKEIAPIWDNYHIQTNLGFSNLGNVFYSHLNSTTSTLYDIDVKLHDQLNLVSEFGDEKVNIIENKCIYALSFDVKEFSEGNYSIKEFANHASEINDSPSNQSGIVKQGYALGKMIDKILLITGKEKVILVGHSMGGLAIREYLQRRGNGFGSRKWWTNPANPLLGHKVAKVLTVGTPHLGNDLHKFLQGAPLSIDGNSEAIRDLSTNYDLIGCQNEGNYLYGLPSSEVNIPNNYYNKDVNHNGISDLSYGINNVASSPVCDGSTESTFMELPENVKYTYYVSNINHVTCIPNSNGYGCLGDGIVDDMQQWLFEGGNGSTENYIVSCKSRPHPNNIFDYFNSDRISPESPVRHRKQTKDFDFLIRGLDEPDYPYFAYEVGLGTRYSGIAQYRADKVPPTSTPNGTADNKIDSDWYLMDFDNLPSSNCRFEIDFSSSDSPGATYQVDVFPYLTGQYDNPQNSTILNFSGLADGSNQVVPFNSNLVGNSKFYLRITHYLATDEYWRNPYKFKVTGVECCELSDSDCEYYKNDECLINPNIDLLSDMTQVTCQNNPVSFQAKDECYSWYKYDRNTGNTSASPLHTGSIFTPDVSQVGTCEFLLVDERNCHLENCGIILTLKVIEEGAIGTFCEEECIGTECCTSPFTGNIFSVSEICTGEQITFQVSQSQSNYNYSWSSNSITGDFGTGASVTYTPNSTDITAGQFTITLTALDPSGECEIVIRTKTISIKPESECTAMTCGDFPTINPSFGTTTICEGSPICFSVSLTGNGYARVKDHNGIQVGLITSTKEFNECFLPDISVSNVTYVITPYTDDNVPCEGTPITETYTILSSDNTQCVNQIDCEEDPPVIEVEEDLISYCPDDCTTIPVNFSGATVVDIIAIYNGNQLPTTSGNGMINFLFCPMSAGDPHIITISTVDNICPSVSQDLELRFIDLPICEECDEGQVQVSSTNLEICSDETISFTLSNSQYINWQNSSLGDFTQNGNIWTFTPSGIGNETLILNVNPPSPCQEYSLSFEAVVNNCGSGEDCGTNPTNLILNDIDTEVIVCGANSIEVCGLFSGLGTTGINISEENSSFLTTTINYSGQNNSEFCFTITRLNSGVSQILDFEITTIGGNCEQTIQTFDIIFINSGDPGCPCIQNPNIDLVIENSSYCEGDQIKITAIDNTTGLPFANALNWCTFPPGDGTFNGVSGNPILYTPGQLDMLIDVLHLKVTDDNGSNECDYEINFIKSVTINEENHPACTGICPDDYGITLLGGSEVCLGECITLFGHLEGTEITPHEVIQLYSGNYSTAINNIFPSRTMDPNFGSVSIVALDEDNFEFTFCPNPDQNPISDLNFGMQLCIEPGCTNQEYGDCPVFSTPLMTISVLEECTEEPCEINPTITCPENITVSTDEKSAKATVNYFSPIITDPCNVGNGLPVLSSGLVSGSEFNLGSTTVSFSYEGQMCSFSVTVNDTEPPVINICPDNLSFNLDGNCTYVVPDLSSELDYCDNVSINQIVQVPDVGTVLNQADNCLEAVVFLVDPSDNVSQCSFELKLRDNNNPSFQEPDDIVIDCSDDFADLSITGDVSSVSDTCDENPTTEFSDDLSGFDLCANSGTITRTWTVTDASGNFSTNTQTITISDNGCVLPNEIQPAQINACSGSNTELTAPSGYDYVWSNGGSTAQSITVSSTGTNTVTITNQNACSQVLNYEVVYNPSITTATFPSDINVCSGEDATFDITITGGTSPYTVVYTDGNTNEIINNYASGDDITLTSLERDTSFTLIYVVDINGCFISANDVLNITVNDNPSEDQPEKIEICGQASHALTAPSGYSYLWYDSSTNNTNTITTSGDYKLTITNTSGCSQVLTYDVDLYPAISKVEFSEDVIICSGNSVKVKADITGGTAPYTLQISDGTSNTTHSSYTSGSDITLSPTVTTTYTLSTITDANGCSFIANEEIKISVTGCNISNTYEPGDPCSCNDDQTANGAMDGTFGETISVSPTTNGETWTIASVASLASGGTLPSGINVGDVMSFDVANARHQFSFTHSDRSGFLITVEGPNAAGNLNNVTLEISNICKYPIINSDVLVDSINLCMDGVLDIDNLNAETTGMPGQFSYLLDGVVVTQLDLENLDVGDHTLTWIFEGEFMSNANGTLTSIAYPGCSTEVEETFKVAREPLSIACNDQVNITLLPDCEVILSPEVLVEGELPISYTLNLPDGQSSTALYHDAFSGIDWSGLVTGGSTLVTYSISSNCGVACWGDILLENKYVPELSCEDLEVFCYQNTTPGEVIIEYFRDDNPMVFSVPSVTDSDTLRAEFGLDSTTPIKDIEVSLELMPTDATNIEINLVAPDGQTVTLITQNTFAPCSGNKLSLDFIENGEYSVQDLSDVSLCNLCNDSAFCGSVSLPSIISILENTPYSSGLWTLDIIDHSDQVLTPNLLSATLSGNSVLDTISLPIEGDIISVGNNQYYLEDLNCQSFDLRFTDTSNNNDCSSGASLIRTWDITSAQSGQSSTCSQEITLKRFATPLQSSDIVFPLDLDGKNRPSICFEDLASLGNYPTIELAGEPRLPNEAIARCGNYEFLFTDSRFDGCNAQNFKFIRHWQFIDWCTTNIIEHNQVIKVVEKGKTFLNALDSLTVSADQNCLGSWEIDYLRLLGEDIDLSQYEVEVSGANIEDINQDGIADAITSLALGDNLLSFSFINECSVRSTHTLNIIVIDDRSPNIVCIQNTSVALDDNACITLKPEKFAPTSFDNCDDQLSFRIKNNGDQNWEEQLEICCGCSSPLRLMDIEVSDISGNKNTCTVQIEIENLPEDQQGGISGRVVSHNGTPIEDTKLIIEQSMYDTLSSTTNHTGYYAFSDLMMNSDYKLTPYRNTSPLEGVSTLDLILIQRHILGMEKFDSPYQLIASDTDNSGSVNGIDMVELRKLILGITPAFPSSQTSWRFPSKHFTFINNANPFPFEEEMIFTMSDSMPAYDFIGVKIGDVNGSFEEDLLQGDISLRESIADLSVSIDDQVIQKDQITQIQLKLPSIESYGFQVELEITEGIEVLDAALEGTDLSYEYHLVDNKLRISATTSGEAENLYHDSAITLSLVANTETSLSEAISLSDEFTSEIYDSKLDPQPLSLQFNEAQSLEVFQSVPNPFDGQTRIDFSIPSSGDVVFTVSDINGRVVYLSSSYMESGDNSFLLTSQFVDNISGVYFLTISYKGKRETLKIIKI